MRALAPGLLVAALAASLAAVGMASAQERSPLPAWGPGLDVDALAAGAGVTLPRGMATVTLRGTVTSSVDGLRYDAFHRFTAAGAQRAALVTLPPGARVVEEDVEAHSYVIELGASRSLRIDPSVIARRSLAPVSEVVAGLRGSIIVDVTTDPRAIVAPAAMAVHHGSPGGSGEWWGVNSLGAVTGLGALVVAGPAALLLLVGFRRRRSRAKALARRVARAADAVEGEAKRLGPAFLPLATAAAEARGEGQRLLAAHRTARRARRRLRAFGGTGKRRFVDLDRAEAAALTELAVLVDRLEEVAVSIASHDARYENAGDAEAALGRLTEELDVVLSADAEARAVA